MRTTYKFVDADDSSVHLEPYKDRVVANIVTVCLLPSIGDPEDPNDTDELQITLRLVD